jgi:tRNA(fMet)-specific endonuclease VapC
MLYLLDTDTCSYIMRQKPPSVLQRLEMIPIGDVAVSVITVAELRYGVEKLNSSRLTQTVVDDFLRYLKVIDWDDKVTLFYARLRHYLQQKGTPIGNMDLMIAAHALCYDYILVTNNTRHFSQVPQLRIENWTKSTD